MQRPQVTVLTDFRIGGAARIRTGDGGFADRIAAGFVSVRDQRLSGIAPELLPLRLCNDFTDYTAFAPDRDDVGTVDPRTPTRTGLVCPACRQPVAIIEIETGDAITFRCKACGHRWSAAKSRDVNGPATLMPAIAAELVRNDRLSTRAREFENFMQPPRSGGYREEMSAMCIRRNENATTPRVVTLAFDFRR